MTRITVLELYFLPRKRRSRARRICPCCRMPNPTCWRLCPPCWLADRVLDLRQVNRDLALAYRHARAVKRGSRKRDWIDIELGRDYGKD